MWSQIALAVRETYNTNQSNQVSYKQYHNNFKSNFFDRKQHDWKPWEVKKNAVWLPEATVRKYITTNNTKDFIS